MAKVLFFAHFSGQGILSGADKVLLNIAEHRQGKGDQVVVVFPTECFAAHVSRKTGLRTMIIPYVFFNESINPGPDTAENFDTWYQENNWCLALIIELLRAEQATLVHVNTSINPWGAIAAHQLGIPVVWHIHELFQGGCAVGQLTVRKLLEAYADRIICVSHAVFRDLSPNQATDKYQVIHNGTKIPEQAGRAHPRFRFCWRRKMKIGAKVPVAAFLGSILHHKGVFEFIQMADLVRKSCPETVFVLGGNEYLDREYTRFIREQIENYGLRQQVIFAGYFQDVSEFLVGVDVIVVPTIIRETFGMVIIEAMAHAKPVAAFKSGGISEIILQGETGIMVPQGDIVSLATAVKHLLNNPQKARLMGQAGAERVRSLFGLDRQLQRIDSIYQQILGND